MFGNLVPSKTSACHVCLDYWDKTYRGQNYLAAMTTAFLSYQSQHCTQQTMTDLNSDVTWRDEL